MADLNKFCCQKQNCLESCCGAFSGVSDQIASVEERAFQDIVLTSRDLERIQGSQYEKFIYIADDGLGRVKTATNGDCSAYQSGKCRINEVKPTICKCFPLYLDIFIGLCAIKACPSVSDALTIENYTNEVEYFLQMCEFWISYYRNKLNELPNK